MILKYFRQISTLFDIILMYKRMNLDVDRRVAELCEGRRTARAIRDRDLRIKIFIDAVRDTGHDLGLTRRRRHEKIV